MTTILLTGGPHHGETLTQPGAPEYLTAPGDGEQYRRDEFDKTTDMWTYVHVKPIRTAQEVSDEFARPGQSEQDQAAVDATVIRLLRENIDAIRQHQGAGDIARQLRRIRARIERAVDNAQPDEYCGPCQGPAITTELAEDGTVTLILDDTQVCGGDVYRTPASPDGVCSECRTSWDEAELRAWAIATARDEWVRPSAAARLLRTWGYEITEPKLGMWITRDRQEKEAGRVRRAPYDPILQVGIDDDGKPLYRLGDFLDRADTLREIEERRRTA